MTGAARDLLVGLRRRGVVVTVDDGHLHLDAPAGVITDELKGQLTELRSEVLAALDVERRLCEMPLSEFEKAGLAVEIRVPSKRETIWLVPHVEDAVGLVREGIGRGSIWTARELADLALLPDASGDRIRGIARMKAMFGAEIVAVEVESEHPVGGGDASV